MKKQVGIQKLGLVAAAVATFATGCSSTEYARNGNIDPGSNLGFVPLTDARELGKWPNDFNVRAIESYVMVVPAPAGATADTVAFNENLAPGTVFQEAAAGEVRTYQVIRHRPGSR